MEEDGCLRLGDKCSSDVIVNLKTRDGRDDRLYAHSAVLRRNSKYFSACLCEENSAALQMVDSRRCVVLACNECEVDYYIILLRLLYSGQDGGDDDQEEYFSVRNAIGVVKVAARLGCDQVIGKCVRYLESMPWEEGEEYEILEKLRSLGPVVAPVLSRLQPVDVAVLRQVFLSAFRVATGEVGVSCFPKLKSSAQEQLEYMLVEDEDAPLITADAQLKSCIRAGFRDLFRGFHTCIMSGKDDQEEELVLDRLSDLEWATRVLPRVNLLDEIVTAWLGVSSEVIGFLEDPRLKSSFWNAKLRVMEITSKVLEAVGYGSVILPPHQRTQLIKLWLPYIRKMKPVLETRWKENAAMDCELCQNIESAMSSLLLSLPSEDQAEILSDWLENENAGFPDLTEAFEIWCFRCKTAKRRLHRTSSASSPAAMREDGDVM